MPLQIKDIVPLRGTLQSILFENPSIDLPLSLFYSLEIPLQEFDSGHTYVEQPTHTAIVIEWITFPGGNMQEQESNWQQLVGKKFCLTTEEADLAEASVYLGGEHCSIAIPQLEFINRKGTCFEVALDLAIAFNIDTVGLAEDGLVRLKTAVDYQGLVLYDTNFLPSLQKVQEPLSLIGEFVDLSVYEKKLVRYENPHVHWQLLKPK
jgi:hypothetical protein